MFYKIKDRWKERAAQKSLSRQSRIPALYQPLDSLNNEIRLVTLKPGSFDDAISCSLVNVPLTDALYYEALSYTWGDIDSVCQIHLNGQPYEVTTNLECALRYLRHASIARVLWIDALCINQSDVPERNSQVMRMNSIYKQAFEVIAWLGEEAENSNLVFDAFEALPKDESIHWNSADYPMLKPILSEPKYIDAIRTFFQRSWWNRVWTIQESVLAKTLYFACGHRQISADKLFAVRGCFYLHDGSCCWEMLRDFSTRVEVAFYSLDTLYATRSVTYNADRIEELITDYRSRLSSDPRDKIYGLLGIARREDANIIAPDYSSPASQVYEQVALQLVKHTHNLRMFSQICLQRTAGSLRNELPSWVPDWTVDFTHNQFRAIGIRSEMLDLYKASSGASPQIKLIEQGKIALRGIILGSCAEFSKPNNGKYLNNFDVFKFWPDLAAIATQPSRLYANSTSTTYYDAYWQTLCASILADESDLNGLKRARTSADSVCRTWYEAWWRTMKAGNMRRSATNFSPLDATDPDPTTANATGSEIWSFGNFVHAATAMRKLFVSKEEGWLGLAPMDAEVGDRIALLGGGNVPFIVRQKIGTEDEWKLIGDAYVHGIMDGECWKEDELVDIVLV